MREIWTRCAARVVIVARFVALRFARLARLCVADDSSMVTRQLRAFWCGSTRLSLLCQVKRSS